MIQRNVVLLAVTALCFPLAGQYFAPPVFQNLNIVPSAPTVADMDGDGDGDLLSFNDGIGPLANGVIVTLNNGPGAAVPTYLLPVPAATSHTLDAGDLDGDGDIDIVTCNQTSFSVLRNLGGAVSRVDATLAAQRARVRLGDLDADGDLDATFDAQEIWINDGAANFTAAPAPGLVTGTVSLWTRMTDFDGDGDQDIVCAWQVPFGGSWTYPSGTADLWLATFRNDLGGGFVQVQNAMLIQDFRPASLDLADVDGDGDDDVVIGVGAGIGQGGSTSPLASFVWVADVTNGTTTPLITGTPYLPGSIQVAGLIAVGDTDMDGVAEILAAAYGPPSLGILVDVTPPGYVATQYFGLPSNPAHLRLARYDADSAPDIVVLTPHPFGPATTVFGVRLNEAIQGPISLLKISGDQQAVSSGTPNFPVPFVVRLLDGAGTPLPGRDVYVPTVTTNQTNGGGSLSTTSFLGVTNANGEITYSPTLVTFNGGPFILKAHALDQTAQFNCFLRRFWIQHFMQAGIVNQTNQTELANEPIIVAYDVPGFAVPTPYGLVKTGILSGAPTTVIRDGIGIFGPADPAMVGDASGTWFGVQQVPTPLIGSGLQFVIQVYALPANAPWLVSNSAMVTL